ncbi:hypothetical protein Lser_V15G12968 [Lactuca serriola]
MELLTRSSEAAAQVNVADWRKHFPATVIQVRRTELSRRRPPREDYSRGDNETRVSKIRIWGLRF